MMLCAGTLSSQPNPKREVRAVWLTTLGGMDWPAPAMRDKPDLQKSSLVRIFDQLASLRLNTVYFQVRSRGNALYRSALEPWATELTGTLGKDPGWDPLRFAIQESNKRCLSLHAWLNIFKVWSGDGLPPRTSPPHIIHLHPDWVKKYGSDYWLDPGLPEVRKYLLDMVTDLLQKYDFNALHLDYCRYPDADFNDAQTFQKYGSGKSKEDWRRENINDFVRSVYLRAKILRPHMLVGAAPIGIYENLPKARGWQGFHAVAQDSRRWLREGYMDYLAPQIYWGLTAHGSKIDFEALVRDWKLNSFGRHVYPGTAPYKQDVKDFLSEHITACRRQDADGESFFRYEHIMDGAGLGNVYSTIALPPSAPWRDQIIPNPPRYFSIRPSPPGTELLWTQPSPAVDADTASQFVLYRSDQPVIDFNDAASILAVLPGSSSSFSDHSGKPGYSYAISSLDRMWNESNPISSTAVLAGLRLLPAPSRKPELPQVSAPQAVGDSLILIAFSVTTRDMTRLRLMNENGAEIQILFDEMKEPGTYVIGLSKNKLPEQVHHYVYEAGTVRIIQPFTY
jgi:uncharacterized lipoprotein YddW (UPF0748 family)